jgi:SNF2 family DNA or RNA helicase
MPTSGTLSIELSDAGIVTFCIKDNVAAWAHARLLLLETTTTAEHLGGECLLIPWWEFAPLLPKIQFITRLFPGLVIEADARSRELISRSIKAADSIEGTAGGQPVTEDVLVETLHELGWSSERVLNAHQVRNVLRLVTLSNAATFSVPGAGKTTEALATYIYRSRLDLNLVVVSPKNAFAAWDEQVEACLPSLAVTRLVGGRANIERLLEADPKISIITYSQLVNSVDIVQRFLARGPSVVFLDESHKIKGGEHRAWASAALAISHLPQWKLLMSGTPMPNAADDLIPQIRFLYPNLGAVDDPISVIQRFFVRTTKTELNLPEVKSRGIPIPLTDAQARIYRLCAKEVSRDAEKALRSRDKNVLRAFGRSYLILLQLVSNPSLLAAHQGRFDDAELIAGLQSDSPKIAYTCFRARQLATEGHKVLIWSGFVRNVELLAERLADLGADYIHGGVETGSEEDDATREHKIARFHNDPRAMVLVANPAACAEGISLHTVCHHALYLDRNYNAAQFLQSADRIHRLGLRPDQKTFIEFVYCPGTIDESVNRRLDFKIQQMEHALDDPSISLPTHWLDDLDELPDSEDIKDLLDTLRGNEV